MRYRKGPKTQLEKNLHKLGLFMLSFACFFTDNAHLSSASPFNTFKEKNLFALRVPASIDQSTFDFDCSHPLKVKEAKTSFETIRLVLKNCEKSPEIINTKFEQKMHSFPIAKNNFSSEFAYLTKGANEFVIKTPKQDFKINIFRY